MGRPRINPPAKCAETIKTLASQGFELLGIAEQFGVHLDTLNEWMGDEPKFEYAYRVGREIERQALHKIVFDAAKANQAANNNARFLLRSKHGYVDDAKPSNTVNVAIDARPVMVVRDHGTDEGWAAKAATQQAALVANAASPPLLEAPANEALQTATDTPKALKASLPIPALNGASCADSVPPKAPSWDASTWRPNA